MRVRVDSEKCQGHNRCYALAPGMFKVDDYGYAKEIDDGALETPDDVKLAELAVANCPERAISIEEDEG